MLSESRGQFGEWAEFLTPSTHVITTVKKYRCGPSSVSSFWASAIVQISEDHDEAGGLGRLFLSPVSPDSPKFHGPLSLSPGLRIPCIGTAATEPESDRQPGTPMTAATDGEAAPHSGFPLYHWSHQHQVCSPTALAPGQIPEGSSMWFVPVGMRSRACSLSDCRMKGKGHFCLAQGPQGKHRP